MIVSSRRMLPAFDIWPSFPVIKRERFFSADFGKVVVLTPQCFFSLVFSRRWVDA